MKQFKNSKTSGNALEKDFALLLENSGIPYTQENTMSQFCKRVKGSVDFVTKNPVGYFECKAFTDRLTFKLNSEKHDVKWSQITFLNKKILLGFKAGLVIRENTDKRLIFVDVKDFLTLWTNTTSKSINLNTALKIGRVFEDAEWIKR